MAQPDATRTRNGIDNKQSGTKIPTVPFTPERKVRAYPDISAYAASNCTVPGSKQPEPAVSGGSVSKRGANSGGHVRPARAQASVPSSRSGSNNGGSFTNQNLSANNAVAVSKGSPGGSGGSNLLGAKRKSNKPANGGSNPGRNNQRKSGNNRKNGQNFKPSPVADRPMRRYDALPKQNTDGAIAMVSNNVSGYTSTLANPKENMCRIPDSSIDATALVRSIRTFEVDTFFTGSADDGKFSIAVQPKPGNTDDPSHYQSLIVNSSNGWPTGKFADSNVYLQQTEKSGDPRLDSNWNTLFSQPTGIWVASALVIDQRVLGGEAQIRGESYGLDVQYDAATGVFILPPGTYLFALQNSSTEFDEINIKGDTTVLYDQLINSNYSSQFLISATDGKNTFHPYFNQQPPYQNFTTFVTITATSSEGTFSSANYGNVTMLRPVGMSVLCTFTGTDFSDGGRIATGLMRPGALTTQFLTNSPVGGNQLQEVETLGTIPGTYNGQFKNGVYSYWLPMDKVKDLAFYTPDEANAMEYPFIVASGQLSTTGTVTTQVIATIRIEVSIVFEFQTQSSMWELQRCLGDDARLSMALMIFMNQPNSMENEQHAKWVRWLLTKGSQAYGFYLRNKDPIDAIFRAGLMIAGI